MTPEERKAYNRKYYIANKDHIRAINNAWSNAHPNFTKEYNNLYYQRNKDAHRAATREWECRNRDKVLERHRKRRSNPEYLEKERIDSRKRYQEHPERWAAAGRKWIKNNPNKAIEYSHRRRSKKANAEGMHTVEDTERIRRLQKNKCAYCKSGLGRGGHLDHIKALSNGGSNWPANLQWLCASCNCSKGAKDEIEFMQSRGRLL